MKLLRYGPKGQEKPGLLDKDGQIRDLSGVVKDIDGKVLADLSAIRAAKVESLPVVAKGVRIAEPVAKVGKFLCIGLNYADHAKESNMPEPAEPIIFMKATSRHHRPQRRCLSAAHRQEGRLGSGTGHRDRQGSAATSPRKRRWTMSRAPAW